MIILDSSTSLEIVQSGASATNASPIVASFHNIIAAGDTMGVQTSTTNGTTAVTAVTAPSSSNFIGVKSISINNADTAAITVTFRTNNGGTTRIVFKAILAVGETLQYEDGAGWSKITTACAVAVGTPLGYRLIAPPITYNTALTSFKVPVPSNCDAFDLELLATGGGGGSTNTGSGIMAGGGGSAGGYLRVFVLAVSGQNFITVTLAGGGSTTNTNGGTGTDCTAAYNGVTYTAKAGTGGKGAARSSAPNVLAGGAGQLPTNGDFNTAGHAGQYGLGLTSTVAISGSGGSSVFGGGGVGKTGASSTGSSPVLGGGAGGAISTAGSISGGSALGIIGLFSVRFYAKI